MAFKETFSVSLCQADENLFNAASCPLQAVGIRLQFSGKSHLFHNQGKKKWAQEMFTYWELNFNICSLANESEVQVCSLLHSMNLESTPGPALH